MSLSGPKDNIVAKGDFTGNSLSYMAYKLAFSNNVVTKVLGAVA